jgi:hypothetical protein
MMRPGRRASALRAVSRDEQRPWSGFMVQRQLLQGGDDRLDLDPRTGFNRYGCGVRPDPYGAGFGSSTASVISAGAYAAATACANRLEAYGTASAAYEAEAQRVRERLAQLCGLSPNAANDIVLAASGTDVHLIAADLARGERRVRLVSVLGAPEETGRGVPQALRGLTFSSRTPHGVPVVPGEALEEMAGEILTVALRDADGAPRPAELVDADFERRCRQGLRQGGRVLINLVDVSKTGMIAPSPRCALHLKAQFGDKVTVLVDACQFRLSPANLAAYLANGFLVALTGSKFVGGPAFSGALMIPKAMSAGLRGQPLSRALNAYCGRRDWPSSYIGRNSLPDVPNLGLLFRWEAALHELGAFRALPAVEVRRVLEAFAHSVTAQLETCARFRPLSPPQLRRLAPGAWDEVPTIFPFMVSNSDGLLSGPRLQALYERLRGRSAGRDPLRLGQPVTVGVRRGEPLVALRLSISAPLVVEALSAAGGIGVVIDRAHKALAATAACADLV